MSTAQFSDEDLTVARIFLVDAEGFSKKRSNEIIRTARLLARDKEIPLGEAVAALAKAMLGYPRRLSRLGIDAPSDLDAVLPYVHKLLTGGS